MRHLFWPNGFLALHLLKKWIYAHLIRASISLRDVAIASQNLKPLPCFDMLIQSLTADGLWNLAVLVKYRRGNLQQIFLNPLVVGCAGGVGSFPVGQPNNCFAESLCDGDQISAK